VTQIPEKAGKKHDTRFKPGQSGNPAGKPKGTRNKATLLIEQLLDDSAKDLGKKVIELAKNGDTAALRICLDRLAPPRKDRHISFALPVMNQPADAAKGLSAIIAAVANEELTPSEAAELTRLVESFARVLETVDHEERLRALEGKMGNGKP
jgi:Family of unknown function (DUF5681)